MSSKEGILNVEELTAFLLTYGKSSGNSPQHPKGNKELRKEERKK